MDGRRAARGGSRIPLIGGLAGMLDCLIVPVEGVHRLWWLPLLLDLGCVPMLLHVGIYLLFVKRRGENEDR